MSGEHVIRWRQRAKQKLIEGFGGSCGICGYARCTRALTIHHLDPTLKRFGFATKGIPRAWKKLVDEANLCVMLCHNCHEEVHDRITEIPDNIRRFIEPAPLPLRGTVIRKRRTPPGSPRQKKVPDRVIGRRLREMVNETSRVSVAKHYGVSETAVRKWLKQDSRNGIY